MKLNASLMSLGIAIGKEATTATPDECISPFPTFTPITYETPQQAFMCPISEAKAKAGSENNADRAETQEMTAIIEKEENKEDCLTFNKSNLIPLVINSNDNGNDIRPSNSLSPARKAQKKPLISLNLPMKMTDLMPHAKSPARIPLKSRTSLRHRKGLRSYRRKHAMSDDDEIDVTNFVFSAFAADEAKPDRKGNGKVNGNSDDDRKMQPQPQPQPNETRRQLCALKGRELTQFCTGAGGILPESVIEKLKAQTPIKNNSNGNSNGNGNNSSCVKKSNASGNNVKSLPIVGKTENGCPLISGETLLAVMANGYKEMFDHYVIIDCRFDYEYNGGHLCGALHVQDKQFLELIMRANMRLVNCSRIAWIFHCEHSHRGQQTCQEFRSMDRGLNRYPNISFPHRYVLQGGYKKMWDNFANYDENATILNKQRLFAPVGYISMWDEQFGKEMNCQTTVRRDCNWM